MTEMGIQTRVTLRPLTLAECQQVRVWRDDPAIAKNLRTGSKTEAEQTRFYHEIVCAPPPQEHVYHALVDGETFLGLGGLTHLSRWPGEGELSLLLGPPFQGRGYGRAAVASLLTYAFETLHLEAVIGESYRHANNWYFWERLVLAYGWRSVRFGQSFFFRLECRDARPSRA